MTENPSPSFFSPLSFPAYRALWVASMLNNIGSMMHSVAVAWLITGMPTSPSLVAMVPVAGSLAGILATLPAGVCCDFYGKRAVLFYTATWCIFSSLCLVAAVLSGVLTPTFLLLLVFSLGLGDSARFPAWQASIQDVLPKKLLANAVSLSSISFNVARSVGPAFGGFLVACTGAASVIFLNALSSVAVLFASQKLQAPQEKCKASPREFFASFRQGSNCLFSSNPLVWIMLRLVSTHFLSACIWAFLPLIGRDRLSLSAFEYGLLLSSTGIAAIASAALVPALRQAFPVPVLHGLSCAMLAAGIFWIAACESFASALGATAICGFSLVSCNVHLNVTFQHLAPDSLRGRLISFYFLGFEIGLASGAWISGRFADIYGIAPTMMGCAALLLLSAPLSLKIPVLHPSPKK